MRKAIPTRTYTSSQLYTMAIAEDVASGEFCPDVETFYRWATNLDKGWTTEALAMAWEKYKAHRGIVVD